MKIGGTPMKRFCLVIFAILLCITGCNKHYKTMICTKEGHQNDLKIDLTYTVSYRDDYVLTIKTDEKITSENREALQTYKKNMEDIYSVYKDIAYYKYDIAIKGDTLHSRAHINYEKIDTDKILKIDPSNQDLIKDGKVHIADIASSYEALGATCKK